jgi:outer membrane PBP1 activator LpoA protein
MKVFSRSRTTLAHCLVLVLATALTACGKHEPAPDPLKAQRSAVEKAKGVNDVVTGAAADQRKQIDEQETK